MTTNLPQEIVDLIADYLHDAGASLAPCTTVCRQWRAAFEPLIYSALNVYSADDVNRETSERRMSLSHFQAVASGRRMARRALIHRLRYYLVVPIALPNWKTRKFNGYNIDNDTRKNNDVAFQSAITNLFNIIAHWDQSLRISVELMLLGLEAGKEPYTYDFDIAGDYSWDFTKGKTKAVPVYRAKFVEDGASLLPDVSCIDRLSFESPSDHQIWAGSAMQIVQHCPTITEIRLDLDEWIRPDHLEYIQARRQAISDGLEMMPRSLRVFDFSNQDEAPWEEMMPGLNVLTSDNDSLSPRLGYLSLSLCELKVEYLSLAPDFLYPLDGNGYPLPNSTSLHWPRLEKLELLYIPARPPSGQWLAHPSPEAQKEIDEIEDWDEIICDCEEGHLDRDSFESEHFHKVLISMGHAACNMPRLVSMRYYLNHSPRFMFDFKTQGQSGNAEWVLESTYRPDQRVADAWKFSLVELDTRLPSDGNEEITMIMHPPWDMQRGHDLP